MRNAAYPACALVSLSSSEVSEPIRRTRLVGCARAASGHAAAPPSADMNSRRPILIVIDPARWGPEAQGNEHCYHALIAVCVKSVSATRAHRIVRYQGYFCRDREEAARPVMTQLRHWVHGGAVRRVRSDAPKHYARGGGGAGVRPWRRMISAIFARSGGPSTAALITSADSRKYCGPIAAGVITQSALASCVP